MSFEGQLVGAAMLAWLAAGVCNLIFDPWFGYDESAFAAVARGDPAAFWLYRSRGVVALARLGLELGPAPWAIRIPFLVVDLALPLAAYLLGSRAYDQRTGAWAAAVIVTSHQLLARNAHVLGDVPATACFVIGIAIAAGELARNDGPRWRLLLAAPAFAGAFYLRYGSAPVVAVACLLAPVVWWRSVRKRPLVVLATGAALAVLLLPHLLHSCDATGSPVGVLEVSAGVPRRAYIGEGLVTYLTTNPFRYYGALIAPCLVAALVGVVLHCSRVTLYLFAVALVQVVAIGMQSHAQPRYVFIATTLLAVIGVDTVRRWRLASQRLALAIVATTWLVSTLRVIEVKRGHEALRASIAAAARAIQSDADRPCLVIAHSVPELVWATKCDVVQWYAGIEPQTLDPPRALYLVETATGGPIDVRGALAELPTTHPKTRVWRLR